MPLNEEPEAPLEVESEPTHKDGGHNNGCCCVCQFGDGLCWPSVCCHEVVNGQDSHRAGTGEHT